MAKAANDFCLMISSMRWLIGAFLLAHLCCACEGAPVTNVQVVRSMTSPPPEALQGTNAPQSPPETPHRTSQLQANLGSQTKEPNFWLGLGVLIALANSCVAVWAGVAALKRSRKQAEMLNDKVLAELKTSHALIAAAVDGSATRILESIRALDGTFDSALKSLQPSLTRPIPVTRGDLEENRGRSLEDSPSLGTLEEEFDFLRWIQANASSSHDIATTSGYTGHESSRTYRLRASKIPLEWVKADVERAVVRLGLLNQYARKLLNLGPNSPALIRTPQSRLPLDEIDKGTPSPWVVEVDVDLLSQVIRETDIVNPRKATK
jgi:hypothetical protein